MKQDQYLRHVFSKAFLPAFLYYGVSVWYYVNYMEENIGNYFSPNGMWWRIFIFLLWVNQVSNEFL